MNVLSRLRDERETYSKICSDIIRDMETGSPQVFRGQFGEYRVAMARLETYDSIIRLLEQKDGPREDKRKLPESFGKLQFDRSEAIE